MMKFFVRKREQALFYIQTHEIGDKDTDIFRQNGTIQMVDYGYISLYVYILKNPGL